MKTRPTGHARRGGYTMVEVAVSMTLFAIGAAAVVAMERTSVQGDADARQQDVATQIAYEWVARLQRDALNWKTPTSINPTLDTRDTNTTYLNNAYNSSMSQCGGGDGGPSYIPVWNLPGTLGKNAYTLTGNVDGRSYAFDMFGRDRAPTDTNPPVVYCVQVAECFQDNPANAPPLGRTQIQANVRVVWARKINGYVDPAFCAPASTTLGSFEADGGADLFRGVSMTVLLQGVAQQ